MSRERLSPRYTMMTLLGLYRYERSGLRSPVAISPVLDALLRDTRLDRERRRSGFASLDLRRVGS